MLQNYLCNVSHSFGPQIYFVLHSENKSKKQVSWGQAVNPSHPAETCELLIESSANIVGAYEIFSFLTELLNEINLLSIMLLIILIPHFSLEFQVQHELTAISGASEMNGFNHSFLRCCRQIQHGEASDYFGGLRNTSFR